MIFVKANQRACEITRTIMDEYCAISGQKVNYHKSAYQTTKNVNNQQKYQIQQILNITNTTNLEKYLGCPIINGRVNKETFEGVIRKSKSQLSKWKANALSQEGRSTLIRLYLSTKSKFIMQSFMLNNKVHNELDKTNRNFFWNKDANYKPLIGWDRICKPKAFGGLGIQKSSHMNQALQMKLIWKILAEPHNIWVRIVTEKYL